MRPRACQGTPSYGSGGLSQTRTRARPEAPRTQVQQRRRREPPLHLRRSVTERNGLDHLARAPFGPADLTRGRLVLASERPLKSREGRAPSRRCRRPHAGSEAICPALRTRSSRHAEHLTRHRLARGRRCCIELSSGLYDSPIFQRGTWTCQEPKSAPGRWCRWMHERAARLNGGQQMFDESGAR